MGKSHRKSHKSKKSKKSKKKSCKCRCRCRCCNCAACKTARRNKRANRPKTVVTRRKRAPRDYSKWDSLVIPESDIVMPDGWVETEDEDDTPLYAPQPEKAGLERSEEDDDRLPQSPVF